LAPFLLRHEASPRILGLQAGESQFILNSTGWELGKVDDTIASSRRFMMTGATPSLAIGRDNRVAISQRGSTISVSVDAKPVISYADYEAPYTFGKLGLYCEDSVARFGQITISTPDTSFGPTASR
jgi:hypothetical protein